MSRTDPLCPIAHAACPARHRRMVQFIGSLTLEPAGYHGRAHLQRRLYLVPSMYNISMLPTPKDFRCTLASENPRVVWERERRRASNGSELFSITRVYLMGSLGICSLSRILSSTALAVDSLHANFVGIGRSSSKSFNLYIRFIRILKKKI